MWLEPNNKKEHSDLWLKPEDFAVQWQGIWQQAQNRIPAGVLAYETNAKVKRKTRDSHGASPVETKPTKRRRLAPEMVRAAMKKVVAETEKEDGEEASTSTNRPGVKRYKGSVSCGKTVRIMDIPSRSGVVMGVVPRDTVLPTILPATSNEEGIWLTLDPEAQADLVEDESLDIGAAYVQMWEAETNNMILMPLDVPEAAPPDPEPEEEFAEDQEQVDLTDSENEAEGIGEDPGDGDYVSSGSDQQGTWQMSTRRSTRLKEAKATPVIQIDTSSEPDGRSDMGDEAKETSAEESEDEEAKKQDAAARKNWITACGNTPPSWSPLAGRSPASSPRPSAHDEAGENNGGNSRPSTVNLDESMESTGKSAERVTIHISSEGDYESITDQQDGEPPDPLNTGDLEAQPATEPGDESGQPMETDNATSTAATGQTTPLDRDDATEPASENSEQEASATEEGGQEEQVEDSRPEAPTKTSPATGPEQPEASTENANNKQSEDAEGRVAPDDDQPTGTAMLPPSATEGKQNTDTGTEAGTQQATTQVFETLAEDSGGQPVGSALPEDSGDQPVGSAEPAPGGPDAQEETEDSNASADAGPFSSIGTNTESGILFMEVAPALRNEDAAAIIQHVHKNPNGNQLRPIKVSLENHDVTGTTRPPGPSPLRVKTPDQLGAAPTTPSKTLRSARGKKKLTGIATADPRAQRIEELLAAAAARNGRTAPNNMDIPFDAAALVIKVTPGKGCKTPEYDEGNLLELQAYYSELLSQCERWIGKILMENKQPPAPTLSNNNWVQHSWWWCLPSQSFRGLVRLRYNGIKPVTIRDPDQDDTDNPDELSRARLDPLFAPW